MYCFVHENIFVFDKDKDNIISENKFLN